MAVVAQIVAINSPDSPYCCRQPDLCYEWFCAKAASPLPYTEVAKEYAHFFVATVDAIRSLNDDRIKVQTTARASPTCSQHAVWTVRVPLLDLHGATCTRR